MKNEENGRSRRSVVVRVCVWAVVLALLLGIFITLMLGGNIFGLNLGGLSLGSCGSTDMWYDDTGYEVGNTDIHEVIHELKIDWIDGSVTVTTDPEAEALTIREQDRDGGTPDQEDALRWIVSGGKLTIRAYRPMRTVSGSAMHKELEVRIPAAWFEELDKVDIDTVSGDIDARLSGTVGSIDIDTVSGSSFVEAHCNKLSVDSTSGSVTMQGECNSLSVDTVSGKTFFTGTAEDIELDSTSGNMTITLLQAAHELEMDTVSGQLVLTLPEDVAGFTAELDSVSGDIEIQNFAVTSQKHTRIYGDGSMKIEMDSTSGDLTIKPGAPSGEIDSGTTAPFAPACG